MTDITLERDYRVIWGEDEFATLHIQLTSEGIIADVFAGGVHVGTWAMTDQELTDNIQEVS